MWDLYEFSKIYFIAETMRVKFIRGGLWRHSTLHTLLGGGCQSTPLFLHHIFIILWEVFPPKWTFRNITLQSHITQIVTVSLHRRRSARCTNKYRRASASWDKYQKQRNESQQWACASWAIRSVERSSHGGTLSPLARYSSPHDP